MLSKAGNNRQIQNSILNFALQNNCLVTYNFRAVSKINQFYVPNKPTLPQFKPSENKAQNPDKQYTSDEWDKKQIIEATEKNVVFTWGATDPMRNAAIPFKSGKGIYLYDYDGKEYIDMSSQAIQNNLGYTIPKTVLNAINHQLKTMTCLYGGLTLSEPKAKLASILNDITPAGITGFLFPLSGSEANEVAIRAARRFTGKSKILTRYKSYHGGTSISLTATGDFRRTFGEAGVSGFVKFFDFQAFQFQWGQNQQTAIKNYLAYLEEVILNENPDTIAAILIESVCGSAGVLINPPEVMQGVRALCDKYKILLIMDEVMAGYGRTGEMFGFQNYPGLVPDMFTSAKGLSGSYLPISAVGMKTEIQDFFRKNALGWGTTYQAHPVSCIAAYEVTRYMIENKICDHVKKMEKVLKIEMKKLIKNHNSIRQGRVIGLFGCVDIVGADGNLVQKSFSDPVPEKVQKFKKELLDKGIQTWVRSPIMHLAPPLIIRPKQLKTAMGKIDEAFKVLDN